MTEPSAPRTRDGVLIHDGAIHHPTGGCPRGLLDCSPLARCSSPEFKSYMCCGETDAAPVVTDRLRLCIFSTHEHGVDLMVNLDERDAVDTASVLLGGMSSLAQAKAVEDGF